VTSSLSLLARSRTKGGKSHGRAHGENLFYGTDSRRSYRKFHGLLAWRYSHSARSRVLLSHRKFSRIDSCLVRRPCKPRRRRRRAFSAVCTLYLVKRTPSSPEIPVLSGTDRDRDARDIGFVSAVLIAKRATIERRPL